jgi:hypothetical protein
MSASDFDAIVAAGYGVPADLGGWRAALERADPGLLAELDCQRRRLEALAPQVAAELARMVALTDRFAAAFARVHPDPGGLAAEHARDPLEESVGVPALWRAAEVIRRAHPDPI